jgi:GAF domain-containing protein
VNDALRNFFLGFSAAVMQDYKPNPELYHSFNEEDESFLALVAACAGHALHRMLLLQRAEFSEQRANAILEVIHLIFMLPLMYLSWFIPHL